MNLQQLSEQYRSDAALMELRIVQLQYRLQHTEQLEIRRRLKHRIGVLRVLMGEGRRTGYDLAHYYERPSEEHSTCQRSA